MRASEACYIAGVSYRQFDHWARKGYLPLVQCDDAHGSGKYRDVSSEALEHLTIMAELVRAGARPVRASILAQTLQENPDRTLRLGTNLVLVKHVAS